MKKLLFTLAALLSAGLFASAQVPEFAFSEDEITVTPGGDAYAVQILLTKDAGQTIQGGQLQWVMRNAALEEITTGVVLDKVNIEEDPDEDPTFAMFKPGYVVTKRKIGVTETQKNAYYRVLLARLDGKPILNGNEYESYEDHTMWTIFIAADADWADEYATLELVDSPEFGNVWVLNAYSQATTQPAEDLDLTGEIVFGELDEATGNIPVSYDGPEEVVLTATINGEPVEIVDGMITLPAYGEYEVYVYANAEGYKEESRMKIFTWTEPV